VNLGLRKEIETRVAEVLKTEVKSYQESQVLSEIRGWDSIRFMRFLMSLEKSWEIRFEAFEVARISTWGELLSLIVLKRGSA
jgi:acyl carrier protein